MYVKRIPILLPPWLYRSLSEKNLELAKIIDLDYLAEKISPIDIACIYYLNEKGMKYFSLVGDTSTVNPLKEYWQKNKYFDAYVCKQEAYALARLKSFFESGITYKDINNRYIDNNYKVFTLPVNINEGVIMIVPFNGQLLLEPSSINEITYSFIKDFIKFNGNQGVTECRELWVRLLYLIESSQ